MEGFSVVTPVTGVSRPNTGKEDDDDDDDSNFAVGLTETWFQYQAVNIQLRV
jgi:hypothetical protein